MSYKIEAIIKNEKHILNKVEEPTYMMSEPEMIQKMILSSYIYSNFRDIMDSPADIQEAKYKKGNKIIMSFKY